jgi:FkbM family methyltransferase
MSEGLSHPHRIVARVRRVARTVRKSLEDAGDLPRIAVRQRRVRRATRNGRRIFIDLGAYDGDTIELAMAIHPETDLFVAFEPSAANLAVLRERYEDHPAVRIVAAAVGVADAPRVQLYHAPEGMGHSLLRTKAGVTEDDAEPVAMIDFSRYLREEFGPADRIVLKVDIEGAEYDLLEHMIADGSIDRIATLYCEWHHRRTAVPAARHRALVRRLRARGFAVTGRNRRDEFARHEAAAASNGRG